MSMSTPRAQILLFAPHDEVSEQSRPHSRQTVRIGRELPCLVLPPKADLVLMVMYRRPWAVRTERQQPRRIRYEAQAMSVIFAILPMAMVEYDNEDTRQLDQLLKALKIDHLGGPNVFDAKEVANLMFCSSKSAHIDANLGVSV